MGQDRWIAVLEDSRKQIKWSSADGTVDTALGMTRELRIRNVLIQERTHFKVDLALRDFCGSDLYVPCVCEEMLGALRFPNGLPLSSLYLPKAHRAAAGVEGRVAGYKADRGLRARKQTLTAVKVFCENRFNRKLACLCE